MADKAAKEQEEEEKPSPIGKASWRGLPPHDIRGAFS